MLKKLGWFLEGVLLCTFFISLGTKPKSLGFGFWQNRQKKPHLSLWCTTSPPWLRLHNNTQVIYITTMSFAMYACMPGFSILSSLYFLSLVLSFLDWCHLNTAMKSCPLLRWPDACSPACLLSFIPSSKRAQLLHAPAISNLCIYATLWAWCGGLGWGGGRARGRVVEISTRHQTHPKAKT